MTTARRPLVLATLTGAMLLAGGLPAAQAQSPPALTKKVTVTGTKGFEGTYTIERFVRKGSRVVAVGTLRGTLRGKTVRRTGVRMPASLSVPATGSQAVPTPGACQVLFLTLGPLRLNVLGLLVRLNQVVLRIEALPSSVPGGGLLGDLLCGIANLLNPAANTPVGTVTRLLNALLALAPTGPAAASRAG